MVKRQTNFNHLTKNIATFMRVGQWTIGMVTEDPLDNKEMGLLMYVDTEEINQP